MLGDAGDAEERWGTLGKAEERWGMLGMLALALLALGKAGDAGLTVGDTVPKQVRR